MGFRSDYVLDYTSALRHVIMETEREAGVLTYRHVYGIGRAHVVVYGIDRDGSKGRRRPNPVRFSLRLKQPAYRQAMKKKRKARNIASERRAGFDSRILNVRRLGADA